MSSSEPLMLPFEKDTKYHNLAKANLDTHFEMVNYV